MKLLVSFNLGLTLAAIPVLGGTYLQDLTGQQVGTTDLGDGSEIASNDAVAQVRGTSNPYLRLTRSGSNGTSSSYKLPDLDPDRAISSFALSFLLQIGGSGGLADGAALSLGQIPPGNGAGENGFNTANGLVISWDTFANSGESTSIEVFADGVSIFNFPFDFGSIRDEWVTVELNWDPDGLDFEFNGQTLTTNLATPGFLTRAGDRFAFTGRTGGSTQNTYLDDLNFETALLAEIETGGPVITEFVADNNDSLEDEDLDEPDWLEIYNGQNQTINLQGYSLTNDTAAPARWTFPDRELGPYERIFVFASGKNRQRPNGTLHTHFTLEKDGGYLALIEPDGETIASEFNYQQQAEDVSYGELGLARTLGYLETPTPGTRNSGLQAQGPPAEDVQFDRSGGLFSNSTSLTILPPTSPTAIIRFTTDDSIPTLESPIYNNPFSISSSTTIRARVFESDRLPGETKSRTLLKLNTDLAGFSSNLPIIVVDSNGFDIDANNNPLDPRPFRPVYTVVLDRNETNGLTRLDDTPDFTGRGGMHVRGQSSANFPKKQYAWETWNNEGEDKDVSLLGMPSESDWILQAPYSDKTLMRNVLTYEKARDLNGNPGGVRTRFVEVFFNQGGESISMNDHRGIYVLMEKIKRNSERVDVEKLNDLITDPEKISGGYIFKRDKPPYTKPWNTALENVPLDMHYPESPNEAQFNFLTDYVDNMESVLLGQDFRDLDFGYRAFLDAKSFIDAHLFVESFKNIDGYRISTYFSKTRNGKIKALPIWDYNLAMGNANYLQGDNPQGWYYSLTSPNDYYWYPRLFQDPEFTLSYWDRFWELRHQLFSDSQLAADLARYRDELTGGSPGGNALTRNFEQWDILGTNIWPNPDGWETRTTHQAEVDWMNDWLTDRIAWMETQSRGIGSLARPPAMTQFGGEVPSGFELSLTDPNNWNDGNIYYTLDGSDPRVSEISSALTLLDEDSACEVLVPTTANGGDLLSIADWTNPALPPNSANWITGKQGVGYERSSNNFYDPYFRLNIETEMAGVNRSCYIRIPFTISSQEEIDTLSALTLRMRYDDSFVAYLNGVEIVREANAPDTLTYQAGAVGQHDDDDAIRYFDFDATSSLSQLKVGVNILAIHGLNDSLGSSDALWSCLLKASLGEPDTPSASATIYTSNLTLEESIQVRARIYDGSRWSPLSSGAFLVSTVPASADNLVISELNYRPASPTTEEEALGFTSRGDFEFLELMNIHSSFSISLANITFTDGISFSGFSDGQPLETRVLAPGARLLLVKNESAFRHRHPQGTLVVAGAFSGSLRNEGEQVTLRDAMGGIIRDFTYSNTFPWPEAAGDGSGYSLVLRNPQASPDHQAPESWRSSVTTGGSPGGSDAIDLQGDPLADLDGDGLTALLEYATGSSDSDPNQIAPVSLSQETLIVGEEQNSYLILQIPTNLAARGVTYRLEESSDLQLWTPAEGLSHISTSNDGNGIATRSYRSIEPVEFFGARAFFRLQVTLAQ